MRGVIFDFTGTLFWIEDAATAVRQALGPAFVPRAAEIARLGGINGASEAPELPDHLADAWHRRDLSARLHRRAYSGLAEQAGLTAAQAHLLYERGLQVGAWQPYPDTVETLQRLHGASIPVVLLSNIGWNPRPVLEGYAVADLLTALVLSDERGVMKPDPAIFEMACAELGLPGSDVLMVGDSAVNDGAARLVGAEFVLVDPSPGRAPDTLLRAVGLR